MQQNDELCEQLFKEKYKYLFYVAYSHLKNHHAAEDVVMETFLTAHEKLDKLGESENPGGWLYKTLLLKIKNELRLKNRFLKMFVPLDENTSAPSFEERSDRLDVLRILTGDEVKLLVLVYCEGYSIHEVAEHLGIEYENCKKRIYRAKMKIREKTNTVL